jgi:crotonobetainyl-CoA:carnitine CoA-transferase CaiB-like acyl-CoA transferase
MGELPLKNIKILDLTRLLPGGLCTFLLSKLGAEVIKIEEPQQGDYIRYIPPFINGKSCYFLFLNRGKKSLTLNLKEKEGREIFYKLVEKSDVILEGFRPGIVEKLKIDYKTLKNINSKIIYCSLSGYGQTGPYKNRAGHDINYISLSGILNLFGKEDEILIPPVQIADISGGVFSALSIITALFKRERENSGEYIDVSMLDVSLIFLILIFAKYFADREIIKRGEFFLSGRFPSYNIYQTKDKRYISVGALERKFWENFCRTIGREDLLDSQFSEGEEGENVKKEIQKIFEKKTLKEWEEVFRDKDICCEPVLNIEEVISFPQIKERKIFKEGEIDLPLKFFTFETISSLPSPELGENTEEILKEIGYKKEEIEELKKRNII